MKLTTVSMAGALALALAAAAGERSVDAWMNKGRPQPRPTRTLADLEGFKPAPPASVCAWGGWRDGPHFASNGFFRVEKSGGRWWMVDPDGCAYLHMAVCSVGMEKGPQYRAALPGRFGNAEGWARDTARLLHDHGFNGLGNWANYEALHAASNGLAYTRSVSFMSAFGGSLGIVTQVPGHAGYPDELIPVFHPAFPAFCEKQAAQFASTKDDPWLVGLFSDNELQLPKSSLDRYLTRRTAGDPGHDAAVAWLRTRQGGGPDAKKIADTDREAWNAFVMERYYTCVGGAIRKADPNHLYFGSRLHGSDRKNEALMRVAGRHLGVVAINVYGLWTPTDDLRQWAAWTGRPTIVTEWYAKGMDSGLPNITGAGWTVRTQADRAAFYQHFTLALLESGACVGWHWFKYADNDPTDLKAEPSNRDSNKGIVNPRYEPYRELLDAMKALNTQAYALTSWFERHRP